MGTSKADFHIYAVLVTFDPDIHTLTKCLTNLRPQVQQILVVDNLSKNIDEIRRTVDSNQHVELIALKKNEGLGRAHNVGIKRAKEDGATHVLLLDHDSIPNAGMVSTMTAVLGELTTENKRVAAVGARYLGSYVGNESFFVQFGWLKFRRVFCSRHDKRYVRADFLISSGSLIPVSVLEEIGGMDERLFIDHVDTDWFLRANHKGYPSYGACDAFMEHGLGEQTYRVWLGRWHYLPKHKPFRYYYIFRNSILLYKKPYAPTKWMINDIVRLLFILIFYTLVSDSRLDLLKMISRGVADGFRGVSGGRVTPSRVSC
jgi:rhamnosyltransferase